jgi:hypothetical protein
MFGKSVSVTMAGAFMLALFGGGAYYVFQHRGTPAADFVAALNQKDAGTVVRLLNSNAAKNTDKEVLQLWVNAVGDALGSVAIADPAKVITKSTTVEGQNREGVTAPLKGDKLDAELELEIAGGGVNRFEVLSDAIDPSWSEKLEKTSVYQAEAEAFLKALLSNQPEAAYSLLHAEAQESLSEEEMQQMSARLHKDAGPLKGKPAFVGQRFATAAVFVSTGAEESERRLRLVYDIECETGARTQAALDFKLEGFRFFLVAFDLTGAGL